ncbi:MAG TPA: ABC transporter substrate-binding protein [Rectinema sp.]|nr:ABC transporter substrate-binding protein [Rectinema sp.]
MGKRIFSILAVSFLILAGLTGLSAETTKINFLLNWTISGDHAPYYVAMDKGWSKEEGLDVNVMIGQGSGFSVQMVDAGKAQIGISDAPVPIEARAKGARIKIVGIIFDKHPNCMFFGRTQESRFRRISKARPWQCLPPMATKLCGLHLRR